MYILWWVRFFCNEKYGFTVCLKEIAKFLRLTVCLLQVVQCLPALDYKLLDTLNGLPVSLHFNVCSSLCSRSCSHRQGAIFPNNKKKELPLIGFAVFKRKFTKCVCRFFFFKFMNFQLHQNFMSHIQTNRQVF